MGGSHSSHQRLEDDDEQSDSERGDEVIDISSLEEDEQPMRRRASELLFRSPSSSSFLPGLTTDTNPWNVFQNNESSLEDTSPLRSVLEDADRQSATSAWNELAWQPSADSADEDTLRDCALASCSFLTSGMTGAILGEDWETNGDVLQDSAAGITASDLSRPGGIFLPWAPCNRRGSSLTTISDGEGDTGASDFYPDVSQNQEWMGRSVESLLIGHCASAPVLALPEEEEEEEEEGIEGSLAPTEDRVFDGRCTRRMSACSLDIKRTPHRAPRRTSLSRGANYRRRNSTCSIRANADNASSNGGPNILLSLLAREGTGKATSLPTVPPARRLREMGGSSLHETVNSPSGGILSEVELLEDAINSGDWADTQTIISRLAPRLIGDPTVAGAERTRNGIEDPSLPASASRYHAGGGRLGFERDAFVLAGGVTLLLRVFSEPAFVGDEVILSNDARDLSEETVNRKLAGCWNEVLVSLRELVYVMPVLVENGDILDEGDFLPFLFTVLAHDSCFEASAALIEEILSVQSQSLQHYPPLFTGDGDAEANAEESRAMGSTVQSSTFFLGNVPDLYELWGGFNCRQLAHFCRLLALLIFEAEDRQVLESPTVLKSMELLQFRRDRAARAGRDSSVDMNQALVLGDTDLVNKLMVLLRVMNFGPPLTMRTPYQVMAHFPFIADTLTMVGLSEINNWNDIDRLERLARSLLSREEDGRERVERLGKLGRVSDMLDSLSGLLRRNALEPTNQLGHIIQVINAAQQAGVVVGMSGQRPPRRRQETTGGDDSSTRGADRSQDARSAAESMAAAPVALTDQVLLRRLHADPAGETGGEVRVVGISVGGPGADPVFHRMHGGDDDSRGSRINSPEDAANELQFNAFLLAPFQVEVLFVVCTLLGGRRKLDVQSLLRDVLIPVLEEMFQRLSFGSSSEPVLSAEASAGAEETAGRRNGPEVARSSGVGDGMQPQEEPHGIHGPGCECTPESALSVQFLRVLHNFCDRDCDNHTDRRLLLSPWEREFVFSSDGCRAPPREIRQGLLSKVIAAFLTEPDDSQYRFWLASCIESYLRGSCIQEQLFVAHSGLLLHLIQHVTSDRLHCAGSLQTSFDLLGEMCKGNVEVLRLLMSQLDEFSFHKLMNVAASNLVDSNVFIRALVLSTERFAVCQPSGPNSSVDGSTSSESPWTSKAGPPTRFYLTHSWWDPIPSCTDSATQEVRQAGCDNAVLGEQECDDARPTDWFPPMCYFTGERRNEATAALSHAVADVGHDGWIFSPGLTEGNTHHACYSPDTIERLCWFLDVNRARLLRDLLSVVDLNNINHENICSLNTVLVVVIFAQRHSKLRQVLQELKRVDKRVPRWQDNGDPGSSLESEVESSLIKNMKSLEIGSRHPLDVEPYSRSTNIRRAARNEDVARNFRELIWFWTEYYTHRGRDRLSLEFSSHLRFQEWKNVVSLLGTDDGSSTSLAHKPLRLPRSPYQRSPRIMDLAESFTRGA